MAVLKVISVPQKYADEDAYADLIHYCIRPMKTPGNFIDGFGVLPQLAAEQMQIVSHAYRQDHGIRLRHWIISFEKGEIRDAWHANQFAQQACWFYAERYQILYSVHEDAQNIRPGSLHHPTAAKSSKGGRVMFEDYPDILSPEEAAEALRIGENAIYELLNSKKLSAYKNGRNWLIPKEAVRKYVVEQSKLE